MPSRENRIPKRLRVESSTRANVANALKSAGLFQSFDSHRNNDQVQNEDPDQVRGTLNLDGGLRRGSPEMAPHTSRRTERLGGAVALLCRGGMSGLTFLRGRGRARRVARVLAGRRR